MAEAAVTEDVHAVPSYWLCVNRIYNSTVKYIVYADHSTSYSPVDFYRNLKRCGDVSSTDYLIVSGLAILLIALRYIITWTVFRPLIDRLQLLPRHAKKFPEAIWYITCHSLLWGYMVYILFCGENDLFQRPLTILKDHRYSMPVPGDIYWLYMAEFAFYMHNTYAVFCMDAWRSDSLVYAVHHLITMSLLGFSYAARFHNAGLLVLFVHDISDIWLWFSKCNVYLKIRGGKFYALHEYLSTIGFLIFTGTWFLFRLYWLPLKVLYATSYGIDLYGPPPDKMQFFLLLNSFLWFLQLINIYWTYAILNLIYRVVTGQMKELDDVRDNDVDVKRIKDTKKSMADGSNGDTVKNNHLPDRMKKD